MIISTSNYLKLKEQDLRENPSRRLPICLCFNLNSNNTKLVSTINKELKNFIDTINNNGNDKYSVELAITSNLITDTFVQGFLLSRQIEKLPVLNIEKQVALDQVIAKTKTMAREEAMLYKNNCIPFYKPWLIVISDDYSKNNVIDAFSKSNSDSNQKAFVGNFVVDETSIRGLFNQLSDVISSVPHLLVESDIEEKLNNVCHNMSRLLVKRN